jgi:membrane protein YqaA with SNARE-associated domain
MDTWIHMLLAALALPQWGLASLFLVSFLSATLLPMGSEAAVVGILALNPALFWEVMVVATAGNTLGGMLSWWMGYGGAQAFPTVVQKNFWAPGLRWLKRFGPKACLLSWLPLVGDPICVIAGWLKLSFWHCVGYMAVGKFLRYLVMTVLFLKWLPQTWFTST